MKLFSFLNSYLHGIKEKTKQQQAAENNILPSCHHHTGETAKGKADVGFFMEIDRLGRTAGPSH